MWYIYILRSNKDRQLYVGLTNDLKKRVSEHNKGKVPSTYLRRSFKVIYYETHTDRHDAAKRERFLKTGWGKNWIKRTLKNYFQNSKS